MSDSTTRVCTKCKEQFPATTEYFYATQKGGLNGSCIKCTLEKRRANYLANREKKLEYSRNYYQTNKGEIAKKSRIYQENNREKIRERHKKYAKDNDEKLRKYRADNRDKILARKRIYRQENKEKSRIYKLQRVARKRSLPDIFTEAQWIVCLEYHNYCCAVCGNQLRDLFGNVTPHADHWIPLSSEQCPGTISTNMICLCNECNQSKHNKLPDIWLKEKYGTRKANEILKRVQAYFDQFK